MSKPEENWPLGDQRRLNEEKPTFVQIWFEKIRDVLLRAASSLRLSLTLRIALHYAGQLLLTTIPVVFCLMLALCAAEALPASEAMDALSQMPPENGTMYSRRQLQTLPITQACLLEETLGGGFSGFVSRTGLFFSGLIKANDPCVVLYRETFYGSLTAEYPVNHLLYTMRIVCWFAVCLDLYRVVYFMKHRSRLDRIVLKPITDMAEKAATLSASNLSDRISVEGAKNELKDLALVINGMLDRIEVSYNSQKQFVSDASHELRTPIAVIQGYVGMLQRWGKTDREVLDEGISAIEQEAASMKELVERLLFLARHDKKTLMLEMESFDPLEVMSEIHREAKMLSENHRFELSPVQNSRISGDKDMIKQLMRILLDNAIKYTPSGGNITLGVKKDRTHCILSVTDTGAGISAEELPKVFDRFYRCDEARKSQTSGHGLGLSIARIIVAAHGGKLKVRSKVGYGTTFSVLLPLETE